MLVMHYLSSYLPTTHLKEIMKGKNYRGTLCSRNESSVNKRVQEATVHLVKQVNVKNDQKMNEQNGKMTKK